MELVYHTNTGGFLLEKGKYDLSRDEQQVQSKRNKEKVHSDRSETEGKISKSGKLN